MTMTMKNVLGILGVATGFALGGTAVAQDVPPEAAPPAADAAAPPAADAAPAPAAEAPAAEAPAAPAAEAPAAEAVAAPAADAPMPAGDTSGAPSTEGSGAVGGSQTVTLGYPVYVSPQFTYTIRDRIHHSNNGIGGTFAVGSRFVDYMALEVAGNYTSFKNDSQYGGSAKLTSIGAHLLMFPFPNFLPNFYGLIGGSYDHYKDAPVPDGNNGGAISNHKFGGGSFIGGLGYWAPFQVFGIRAALRAEVDFRANEHQRFDTPITGNNTPPTSASSTRNNYSDLLFNVGLVIPFFTPAPPPPAPPPPPEEPAVVPVAEAPPPAAEPPPPPPAPPCRTPIAGEKVDLSGCASGDVIVLRGVNFDFNKATLTANAKTILDQVVDALKTASAIKVEVGGHTDGKGTDAYNQKLSQKRADAVKAYLVSKGISADRMTTMGYGKSKPIADNNTDEGREQNRRVELKVID